MDTDILLTGTVIFFARICDVSLGTIRTIVTVQGRTVVAFMLGLCEVTIWILVVSTVVNRISQTPVLIIFYALGFATGNVVGILVERKLAFGYMVLRVISSQKGSQLTTRIREMGQPVTVFTGYGMMGPVRELYVVCRRRDMKRLLPAINEIDREAFIITEQARDVNKILKPISTAVTGWRASLKKK